MRETIVAYLLPGPTRVIAAGAIVIAGFALTAAFVVGGLLLVRHFRAGNQKQDKPHPSKPAERK
jgi:hypothetical protein